MNVERDVNEEQSGEQVRPNVEGFIVLFEHGQGRIGERGVVESIASLDELIADHPVGSLARINHFWLFLRHN